MSKVDKLHACVRTAARTGCAYTLCVRVCCMLSAVGDVVEEQCARQKCMQVLKARTLRASPSTAHTHTGGGIIKATQKALDLRVPLRP